MLYVYLRHLKSLNGRSLKALLRGVQKVLPTIALPSPPVCLTLDYHGLFFLLRHSNAFQEGRSLSVVMGRAKRDVHVCPLLPIPAHMYARPLNFMHFIFLRNSNSF
jgi:hypothetical protein